MPAGRELVEIEGLAGAGAIPRMIRIQIHASDLENFQRFWRVMVACGAFRILLGPCVGKLRRNKKYPRISRVPLNNPCDAVPQRRDLKQNISAK